MALPLFPSGAVLDHPGYVAGWWYGTYDGTTANSAAVAALDLLYVYPFSIRAPVTVSRLATRVATGVATSTVKLAVWRNASGRPTGTPAAGSNSALSTATSATNPTTATFSPTVLLTPGVYWAGAVFGTALPTMVHIATSGLNVGKHGTTTLSAAISTQAVGLSTPFTASGDILALNLSGATWTAVVATAGIPAMAFEAA